MKSRERKGPAATALARRRHPGGGWRSSTCSRPAALPGGCRPPVPPRFKKLGKSRSRRRRHGSAATSRRSTPTAGAIQVVGPPARRGSAPARVRVPIRQRRYSCCGPVSVSCAHQTRPANTNALTTRSPRPWPVVNSSSVCPAGRRVQPGVGAGVPVDGRAPRQPEHGFPARSSDARARAARLPAQAAGLALRPGPSADAHVDVGIDAAHPGRAARRRGRKPSRSRQIARQELRGAPGADAGDPALPPRAAQRVPVDVTAASRRPDRQALVGAEPGLSRAARVDDGRRTAGAWDRRRRRTARCAVAPAAASSPAQRGSRAPPATDSPRSPGSYWLQTSRPA